MENKTLVKRLRALGKDPALAAKIKMLGGVPGKTFSVKLANKPADYFGSPIISNSKLSNPGGLSVRLETLRLGSLVHMAVYEPVAYFCCEESQKYEHGLLPASFQSENDKLINRVNAMATKVLACPVLRVFLRSVDTVFEGESYVLLFGVLPVKVKLDARLGKSGHDLKTTSCQTRAEFITRFGDYGYWRQAVLYKEACGLTGFYFTGVSKTAPHNTFLVDTARYKDEMKAAKTELFDMIEAHLDENPDYLNNSLTFLLQHA